MKFWFEKYMQEEGGAEGEGGASGGAGAPNDSGAAPAEEPKGAADPGKAAPQSGDPLDPQPWGEFDLDAFLAYDPLKKEAEPGSDSEPKPGEPNPTPKLQEPNTVPAPASDPAVELELKMLREQLQMYKETQMQQGAVPQAPAQVPEDHELEPLYQVPQQYRQLQVPMNVVEKIFSQDPDTIRAGLNEYAQGIAQLVHGQVVAQAKAREALIAKRVEEKALSPWRQQEAKSANQKFHDDFYGKHKELDKPEWKPYIAQKMQRLAKQMGITQPTEQFLDWAAAQLKAELVKAPVPSPTPVPAQQPQKAPFMTGNGAGRASSGNAPQDDIFETLMM